MGTVKLTLWNGLRRVCERSKGVMRLNIVLDHPTTKSSGLAERLVGTGIVSVESRDGNKSFY